jgi:protein MAK11
MPAEEGETADNHAPTIASDAALSNLLLVCGSYERLLYGLKPTTDSLNPEFVFPAHITCIKTLSLSTRFLATGSTDELVKMYDIKLRKEIGTLNHHTGSITSLAFFKKSHLLTASEDGTIGLVRSSDWELLKVLKGHTGAVNSLAVHPTGKVLLSAGADCTLKTWDLTRGVMSLSTVLQDSCLQVGWSVTGSHFTLLFDSSVEIHSLAEGCFV